MNWVAVLETIGLCLISIIIETISYTKGGKQWFENLKQPKYSFSLNIWFVVGAAYYIIFGCLQAVYKGDRYSFYPNYSFGACDVI